MQPLRSVVPHLMDSYDHGGAGLAEGLLDAEDLARVLTGFRGQPMMRTPPMRYLRSAADGDASAYVFDEESGMVYILD